MILTSVEQHILNKNYKCIMHNRTEQIQKLSYKHNINRINIKVLTETLLYIILFIPTERGRIEYPGINEL